jgi:hypothetical protein
MKAATDGRAHDAAQFDTLGRRAVDPNLGRTARHSWRTDDVADLRLASLQSPKLLE